MSVREDLIAARALIDTPEKWCKGEYVFDGQCCAVGAVWVATGMRERISEGEYSPAAMALREALPARWKLAITLFNDANETTHDDVMSLFDRAIASCPTGATGGVE